MIERCDFSPRFSPQHGVVVFSENHYLNSISYPAVAEVGLRVNKIGESSITYEVGIFERGVDVVKAVATVVQVIVERSTGRPVNVDANSSFKRGITTLYIADEGKICHKI